MPNLGDIKGQMILDVKQALAAYTSARQASISTVTALKTGGQALTSAGEGIAAVGFGMAAGLLYAVDASAKFEKQISYFGAVSNTSAKGLDAVRKSAILLGQQSVYSANQVASAFVELGKSGVSAKDIVSGIGQAVVDLGAAADLPLDTAANIITAAVATFSLSADQAVDVANKLAGAANASIIDVQDLGTSLKYVGGTASALGIPFDDAVTALGLLGKAGIKGSTAGTTLRQILTSLAAPTDKATTELQALGIITEDGGNKFFTATGKLKPLAQVFQIYADATSKLGDQQKVAADKTIFNQRAISSVVALTKAGTAGFNQMNAAIGKTTALDVANKRLNNLAGDVEILRGNIDTLAIQAGGSMQGFARTIVQAVTNIVQAFANLPKGAQSSILVILAVVGGLLIIVGTIGIFAGAVLNIVGLFIQMKNALTLVGDAMKAYKTATLAAAGAQDALDVAEAANPIGIIIVAIIALVAALIWFFTQTKIGQAIWSGFVSFLIGAWQIIASVATTVWNAIVNAIVVAVTFVVDFVIAYFTFWRTVITAVLTTIAAVFTNIWNGIVAVISAVVGFIVGLFTNLVNFVIMVLTPFAPAIQAVIGLVIAVFQFFWELLQVIVFQIGNLIVFLVNWIVSVWQGFMGFLAPIFAAIGAFFAAVWNTIYQAIALKVQATIDFIVGVFNTLVAVISGPFNAALAFIIAVWTTIYNFIASNVAKAVAIVGAVFGTVVTLISTPFNNAVAAVSTAIGKIIGFVSGIQAKINGALVGAGTWLIKVGEQIINGLIKGFTNAVGGVTKWLQGLTGDLAKWKGPEATDKVLLTPVGEMIMDSFTTGLANRVGQVKSLLQSLTTSIPEQMNINGTSDLYSQLAQASNVQASISVSHTDTTAQQQNAVLDQLNSTLQDIADKDTINVEKVEINNPQSEESSESLPTAIRSLAYVAG